MHRLNGGCHCGNIQFEIALTGAAATRKPRACDCDFCRKHDASYVSDPQGMLRIDVKDERDFGKYKQGNGIADFLICRNCGVLVGVAYREEGRLYATVNSRAIEGGPQFDEETPVSPKLLSEVKKVERWKENWFCDAVVNIKERVAA